MKIHLERMGLMNLVNLVNLVNFMDWAILYYRYKLIGYCGLGG
jgi:hypothetical protein